jgi:hypothetical protein
MDMDLPQPPTMLSLARDLAMGLTREQAVAKAAQEMADYLDAQAFEYACGIEFLTDCDPGDEIQH